MIMRMVDNFFFDLVWGCVVEVAIDGGGGSGGDGGHFGRGEPHSPGLPKKEEFENFCREVGMSP